ncbi:MAG: transcriptional regulator [Candidatus Promineifilaceae bacterium]|jgi:DNA-binding transcriptional ArsR family regulator|nr:transcriptional regulator [Anaerolineaceae bacterium]
MTFAETGQDALQPIADIDRAIHAPARLMILALLAAVDSTDFTLLLTQTGLTRGNLASHLSKLEEVGYITVTKEFVDRVPRTLYRLSEAGQTAVATYKANMQQVVALLSASQK